MTSTQAFPPKGRQDTIFNEVCGVIRAPVLVDNTVIHAEYIRERSNVTGTIIKVTPPLTTDFQYTHDRTYNIIEEEDGLRITHPTRDGSRYNNAVYFNGSKLSSSSTPPLLLFAEEDSTEQRLRTKEVQSATYGSRLILQNMRGRNLNAIEFSERTVRLGQVVNIGLRTTDLIQKLFVGIPHSLNSIDVGLSLSGPRAGATNTNYTGSDLIRHSTRFLSANIQGANLISALDFIGRHDGHTIFYDRFGNLLYAPTVFLLTDRTIGESTGVASVQSEPLVGLANRLKMLGKQRANNDDIVITVDDGALQKKQGSIKTIEITDPSIRTETAARRVANEYLRMNRKAQNILRSKGHIDSWDIGPGDVVHYNSASTKIQRYVAVLEATHTLSKHDSNFNFATFETGIERMLSGFSGSGELENDLTEPDLTQQIQTLNYSNTGKAAIRVIPKVSTFNFIGNIARNHSDDSKTVFNTSPDKHTGFIIGHRYSQGNTTSAIGTTDMTKAARGAIGVGGSLSTTASAYTHGSTTLTVASTDGFPSAGTLMIVGQPVIGQANSIWDNVNHRLTMVAGHVNKFGADGSTFDGYYLTCDGEKAYGSLSTVTFTIDYGTNRLTATGGGASVLAAFEGKIAVNAYLEKRADGVGGTTADSNQVTYTGKGATTFTGISGIAAVTRSWSPVARVIYARPRSHETRVCRSRRKVLTK